MYLFKILTLTFISFCIIIQILAQDLNNYGSYFKTNHKSNNVKITPQMTTELMEMRNVLMYPYLAADLLDITQTKPFHDQSLPFRLPFFGFEFNYIYIQKDGHLGFNNGLPSYKYPLKFPIQPTDILLEEDPSLIAVWFAQQDIPLDKEVPGAGVYFKLVLLADEKNITLRDRLILDFREGMIGAADFVPKFALIITWRNMTFINRREERPLKTNTYQVVLATDEMRTYAMFNYEQIQWITHKDNFDGLKGSPAFIGFNAGNTTRTFEFKPYSQEPRIKIMPLRGYGNGLEGRYFFQIDEEVWPGVCIDKDLDPNMRDRLPLTFFPRYGHMLGGVMINVTGPCFFPDDIIICNFENRETKGIYRDSNHASCISPPVFYHGYIDFSITVRGKTIFLGRYYVQPPGIVEDGVVVTRDSEKEILDDNPMFKENPEKLVIKWKSEKLAWNQDASVQISLWGYRETNDLYPSLTFIDTLDSARLGSQRYEIKPKSYQDRFNADLTNIFFGFIAINLSNPMVLGKNVRVSPVLWSSPMPLAWYFRKQWEREYGLKNKWKIHLCNEWYEKEKYGDRFATTVFRCPCTREQALLDRGRFSPDLECNIQDQKCFTFHRGAKHCIRTGRPSVGGSGQTCCYDDVMELLQTADTMYGGRPSRAFIYGKHPFKMRMMIPVLSNYLHDVMPFFFCCKWQSKADDSESCQKYNSFRTSQDCSSYQPPRVASVYGDPHLLTFDNHTYTFNGRGEFSLVHVDHPSHKLDIQGRFEQVSRQYRNDPMINATYLTAIAAKDNQSATVEFRIRPKAARWRYQMYCIVDKEYVFFWDSSLRVQNFRGLTLYQPADIRNMSHIIAMFDSGAGIEVMTVGGHMTVHIYLPNTFINKTGGLLGLYSGNKYDDLVLPNEGGLVSITTHMEELHRKYGMSWRVVEGQERRGVGHSLFYHDAFSFAAYDHVGFEPEFRLPPDELRLPQHLQHLEREMISVCDESLACKYDYILTLDKEFAKVTRMHESWANELNILSQKNVIRCPALPKPKNGRKSENKYWPGIEVRFTCDDGYRLVGNEYRLCRGDGLWSWGYDASCVSTSSYYVNLILYIFAFSFPILLLLCCCLCFVFKTDSRRYHTGEKGIQQVFDEFNEKIYQSNDNNIEMKIGKPIASIPTKAIEADI